MKNEDKISPSSQHRTTNQISDDLSHDSSNSPACGTQSHDCAPHSRWEQLGGERVNAGETAANEQLTNQEQNRAIHSRICANSFIDSNSMTVNGFSSAVRRSKFSACQ